MSLRCKLWGHDWKTVRMGQLELVSEHMITGNKTVKYADAFKEVCTRCGVRLSEGFTVDALGIRTEYPISMLEHHIERQSQRGQHGH